MFTEACQAAYEASKPKLQRTPVERDHYGAHDRLVMAYFSKHPQYDETTFRERFRMSRRLFTKIVREVTNASLFFQQRDDCTGKVGISSLMNCTSAIRQMAYEAVPDSLDEYMQMGATTARDSLRIFSKKAQQNQNPEAGQTSMARDGSVFSNPTQSSQTSGGATSSKASGGNKYSRLLSGLKAHTKKARTDPTMCSEYERYVNSDFVTHLHPKEFATFDVLGFWKEKETMYPVLSRMAMDIISVQASSVASESAFSTSGRVLSIRRTRLTPASLEMCMCLKDHLDAKERKQDKSPLEIPSYDFEEDVLDEEVQRNEAIPLSDEGIALDASSEGTLSPGGPRSDHKRILYKTKHEAARKDVKRAFGVLKQKWKLIKYPTRGMSRSRLSDVMYTCILLHNMIIHDNGEVISPDFFSEEQHRDDDPVRTHEESMQVTQ
ncbi:zinc finger BED domain-containing protein RICESLEEPER 2 [Tanacetum coccineum]